VVLYKSSHHGIWVDAMRALGLSVARIARIYTLGDVVALMVDWINEGRKTPWSSPEFRASPHMKRLWMELSQIIDSDSHAVG